MTFNNYLPLEKRKKTKDVQEKCMFYLCAAKLP